MTHKIDKNLITALYNQRQSGFPHTSLRQTGIWFRKNGSDIKATMSFAIPGFDHFGDIGGNLKGLDISCASAPPASELIFKCNKNERAVDLLILNLAYLAGACDVSRYQWPDRLEWYFIPSCNAAFRDFNMQLNDSRINNNGYRSNNNHGFFPRSFENDFNTTDCYQHLYSFCKSDLIKSEK